MPHKPAPSNGAVPVFVSSSLTVDRKPLLHNYAERNLDDLGLLIESVCFAGYTFTCKMEDKVGAQASLRASEFVKIDGNKGKVLVERAGSPLRAAMRLFWAHFELFEMVWPAGDRSVEDDW